MKKIILIFLALQTLISCIKDNNEGCPTFAELVFVLNSPYSTGDFDSDIGNDVHLHVFKGNTFYSSHTVPYDQIKGGKPYQFKKEFDEEMIISAYAIPAEQSGKLPDMEFSNDWYGQVIQMETLSLSTYKPCKGALYQGQLITNERKSEQSLHRIELSPCFAMVTVMIMNADSFSETYEVGIEGTAGLMRIHDKSVSSPAEVRSGVTAKDGTYTTGTMYLLPSAPSGQCIRVNIYSNNNLLMYVDTGKESIAGKNILIKVNPHNLSVEIIVDEWVYKKQAVTP